MNKLKSILGWAHLSSSAKPSKDSKKAQARDETKQANTWIEPPTRFVERDFFGYIKALIDSGGAERALHYLLGALPDFSDSGLNPKEKLNHLIFLSRMLQSGGKAKHGYHKLLRKIRSVESNIKDAELPPGGGFVELGCGAHDPLALASYFFWNGFEPTYGIDLLPPRNDVYSALSMYDILANARTFPSRYRRQGREQQDFLARIRLFDVAAFERGEFTQGFRNVADQVHLETRNLLECSIPPASISLLTSFAVLEHVSDIDAICRHLYSIMKPGGVIFHFVDLADHRSYRPDSNFGPLSFLTEDQAPPSMNRLRAFEITRSHSEAGFQILKDSRTTIAIPADIREHLQPRFRKMPPEEVGAIKQSLMLRKPAD